MQPIFFHLSAPDPVPLKYIFKEYTNIIPRISKYLSITKLRRFIINAVPPLVHNSLTSTEGEKVHIIYFQAEQNIYKEDKYRVGG